MQQKAVRIPFTAQTPEAGRHPAVERMHQNSSSVGLPSENLSEPSITAQCVPRLPVCILLACDHPCYHRKAVPVVFLPQNPPSRNRALWERQTTPIPHLFHETLLSIFLAENEPTGTTELGWNGPNHWAVQEVCADELRPNHHHQGQIFCSITTPNSNRG